MRSTDLQNVQLGLVAGLVLLLSSCSPSDDHCWGDYCLATGGAAAGGSSSTGGCGAGATAGVGGTCSGPGCGWQLLSPVQPAGSVDNVAFDPREPQYVYATAGASFYRSDDSGHSWRIVTRSVSRIGSLAFPRQNPGTLLAASEDGVLESVDHGSTWQVKALGGLTVRMLKVHPADERIVLAAVNSEGLFRSLDGGTTWLPATQGLPIGDFDGIAGDPSNPARMWVAIEMADAQGLMSTEVLESIDTGWSWHSKFSRARGKTRGLAQCDADPRHMLAGNGTSVVATNDGGRTWIPIAMRAVDTDSIAVGGSDCQTMYIADFSSTMQAGLYRSLDGGVTVTGPHTNGMEMLHVPYVRKFAFDPLDSTHVFGATLGGLFESRNAAAQWTLVPDVGVPYIREMLALPARHEVWAATWGAGMWKWSAATNRWSPIASSDGFSDYFFSLAASPDDPNRMVLGGWSNTLLTEDGGNSYSVVYDQDNFYAVSFSPTSPQEMLAATHTAGVMHSNDAGRHWVQSAEGIEPMPEGAPYPGARYGRAIAYASDGRIYLGTETRGVYTSQNQGATWTAMSSPWSNISVRCLLPTSSSMYACTDSLGVAQLTLDGMGFVTLGLDSLEVTGLAMDRDERMFATSNGGVFGRSDDGSWENLQSDQLPGIDTSVPVVYRDATIAKLIIATPFGVYARDL